MQQAQEKKRREEQQKLYETELSTREIINHVNGIFLTEQPDVFNIKDGHKYDLRKRLSNLGFVSTCLRDLRNNKREKLELFKKNNVKNVL